MRYIPRTAEHTIKQIAESFPAVVIYGARQVGKSTTVNHLFGDTCNTVSLDDIEDRLLAQSNPRLFLETYQTPLIIDEIQKVPTLLDEIKKVIDTKRLDWIDTDTSPRLLYMLTGSNRFELQQGISESLAGRCGVFDMTSFTACEAYQKPEYLFSPDIDVLQDIQGKGIYPHRTRNDIFADIFKGGMPDICTGVSTRDVYLRSYVSTYIERDIKSVIQASNELIFMNFLSILALRCAQELHYSDIAQACGISTQTCKKWISLLETSGIIFLLHPFVANASKRIIKAPKIYFMDCGLCAYLCKWPTSKMLADCAMSGAFFENYVVSELVKNAYNFNLSPQSFLFYYRDTDKKELDLVYDSPTTLYPIEIKSGFNLAKPTKHFSVLSKYNKQVAPGLVVCNTDKIRPLNSNDSGAYQIPVSLVP